MAQAALPKEESNNGRPETLHQPTQRRPVSFTLFARPRVAEGEPIANQTTKWVVLPPQRYCSLRSRRLPQMTNNEAEYQATLLGLALARRLGAEVVEIVSDSEVVVRQMQGQSRVISGRLKRLHQETCRVVGLFKLVTFRHVPRELNCLADALATEALAGRVVQMQPSQPGWLKNMRGELRNVK
jgi:ribonuclease HI